MSLEPTPYAAYKDSGLPWLGEMPAHWELRRAKYFYQEVDERSAAGDEELLSVSHLTGVTPRREKNVTMFLAESNVGHKRCRPGDLAINTMWAWAAALGVARQAGIVSPSYGVYRPLDSSALVPGYVDRLLRAPAYAAEYTRRSTGINRSRLRLYPESFLRIPVLRPPREEQTAIVVFLDHVDRRIRRYIRGKQKLIELLEEQKRAMIEWVVTGKVDPRTGGSHTAYRDSGIDWLGEVPESWRVVRLKSLVSRVTSGSRGWSDFAADSGVLFIRVGNLTRSSIDLKLDDVVRLRLPDAVLSGEATRTRVKAHDILLSITAYIGSVAVVPEDLEEAYVSQHVACCRPKAAAADPRWVAYVLLSSIGQTHGQLSMYGGTKQGLSLDDVKNHIVVLPPVAEQSMLVERIEVGCSRVDTAIMEARRALALLREYRTRLIADVVTGKLDVREAAARLRDEAETDVGGDVESLEEEQAEHDGGDPVAVGEEALA
jgi:type I restriction enzyme, S subunit